MTKKRKIAKLLKRYPFIDFAEMIATEPARRKDVLRNYVDRERNGRWPSYAGLRSLVPDIVGVKRGLDPTASIDFDVVCEGLKLRCHADDLGFNTEASRCLFDFVRENQVDAYADHPRASLRIAPDRTIMMGVEHYIVDGEIAAFRYVHPRRSRLEGNLPDILMSLIHHNYVRGDFAEFGVEILDLSCEPSFGPRGGRKPDTVRDPRILKLDRKCLLPRDQLNEEADNVYAILMELSREL